MVCVMARSRLDGQNKTGQKSKWKEAIIFLMKRVESIFFPSLPLPFVIFEVCDSCLLFLELYETPKEIGMCPCSHYPGKQKEMTSSISCRQSHRFQLLIERRSQGWVGVGGEGGWIMENTAPKTTVHTAMGKLTLALFHSC